MTPKTLLPSNFDSVKVPIPWSSQSKGVLQFTLHYYFKSVQLGLLLIIDNTEWGLGEESVISFQHMQQKLPQSL